MECLLCGDGELYTAAPARPENGQPEAIFGCPSCKWLGTQVEMERALTELTRQAGVYTRREGVMVDREVGPCWDDQTRRREGSSGGSGGGKDRDKGFKGSTGLGLVDPPPPALRPADDVLAEHLRPMAARLEVRMHPEELAALRQMANATGQTVSEYVRCRLFCQRCGLLHPGDCELPEGGIP